MADKKVGSEKELKVEKIKKEKGEWTAKKIATTVIIVILAFLMIGGSFYYIFTPGFREDANAFGYYGKKPVVYEANNVFGRTLQNDVDYAESAANGNYTQMYKSWSEAYQAQVIFEALNGLAEDAKIGAPKELVGKFIIDSGVFNNEDGEFDEEKYNSVHPIERQIFVDYVRNAVPYQVALKDVSSLIIPKNEKSFISDLNKKGRDFSYYNVDYNVYPVDRAVKYVAENENLFTKLDVSIISCETEENAKKAYDDLKSGKSWSDAVKEYSQDNYAENDGVLGSQLYANIVVSNLKNADDINQITSLKKDEFTKPIQGPYAWAVYKLNNDPVKPNKDDEGLVSYAKSVISAKNPEEVKPYIDNEVAFIQSKSKEELNALVDSMGSAIVQVKGATNNIGNSQFFAGMQYSDPKAELALAVMNNEDLAKQLFTGKKGDIIGPVETDGGTLFIRIDNEEAEGTMASLMDSYYDAYSSQISLADMRDGILSSDKHKDNFTEKFFELFMQDIVSKQS